MYMREGQMCGILSMGKYNGGVGLHWSIGLNEAALSQGIMGYI